MATEPVQIDEAKAAEFLGKVIGDYAGAMTTVLTLIGDQLGLFKELAENGPANSEQLAERPASTSATRASGCTRCTRPDT